MSDSLNWTRTARATYVGGAADVCAQGGSPAPDFETLTALMAHQADVFNEARIRRTERREAEAREKRIRDHTVRVAKGMNLPAEMQTPEAQFKRQRGKPQPIVCLTRINPATGKLWGASGEFPSVSAAARWIGRTKPDNVCQAITRRGRCRGERWAYLKDVTADELTAAAEQVLQQSRTVDPGPAKGGAGAASPGRILARA